MGLLLKNGRLLNLQTGELEPREVLIEGDKIAKIAQSIDAAGHEVQDLQGGAILPGFIDMHVHLRQPGYEAKETIATGTKAAARGGYTAVACMPNTRPVIDSPERIQYVYEVTEKEGFCTVLPYGAISKGELGEELTDIEAMKAAGAIGITDDGVGVQSGALMREAMQLAAKLDMPAVIHSEDENLAAPGYCINEGVVSRRLGLPGISGLAESVMIARDILLSEDTGCHLHVCHISDAGSVELVRWAKSRGLRVTAEVTPHHLLLTEQIIDEVDGRDANMKVNPPLRTEKDRIACLEGLLDGTIDMIATDHAPHTPEEKARPITTAPFGFVGLEFAFPVLYTHLVEKGSLGLHELVQKFSTNPAQVFKLEGGEVAEGKIADLTVVDLNTERTINPDEFFTKGRNTPFAGYTVKGWSTLTVNRGRITYKS